MTLGSLFDGSGTCPLAAVMCGITPVWASEIEPFPIEVTTRRFPKMVHLGDITKIDGASIEPVDIISFGSPCQGLSAAGKRAGLDDERSGLFREAIRIIKEMRGATNGRKPRYAIWENVPGAFSSNNGDDFRTVLEEFCKITDGNSVVPRPTKRGGTDKWADAGGIMADGYSVAWRVLDAQFWGVPQRRRRIFLVADFRGNSAGKILFERKGLSRHFAESKEAWQETSSCIGRSVDSTIWDARGNGNGLIAPTITGDHNNRVTDYTGIVVMATQQGGAEIGHDLCPTITAAAGMSGNNQPVVCAPVSFVNRGHFRTDGVSETLRGECHGDTPAIVYGFDAHNLLATGEKSMTLMSSRTDSHSVPTVCFSVDSMSSNSMKSDNPNSGIHECTVSRCLDTSSNPACNQGGNVICQSAFTQKSYDKYDIDEKSVTLRASGGCYGGGSETLVVRKWIARRMTPTECGRLQGFPDGWCADIPRSDSAEYKMWGNGMALPCVLYVFEGVRKALLSNWLDELLGGEQR